MPVDERIEMAQVLYERAVFGGDVDALTTADRGLDGVEADLALARGRVTHARYLETRVDEPQELELFERAAELYEGLGEVRGQGEALFWIGTYHQVVRSDTPRALPIFERALESATNADDKLTMSYVLRHLAFAEQMAGHLDSAHRLFDESTALRREVGFGAGTAANLIALAHLVAQQGRHEEALAFLEEATHLAQAAEANGVLRWIAEAREELDLV